MNILVIGLSVDFRNAYGVCDIVYRFNNSSGHVVGTFIGAVELGVDAPLVEVAIQFEISAGEAVRRRGSEASQTVAVAFEATTCRLVGVVI